MHRKRAEKPGLREPAAKTKETGRAITDEREVVLLALLSYEKNRTFSNILVRRTLDSCAHMRAEERAFIKRLLEGVIERRTELDRAIEDRTGKPAGRLHPAVLQILRMGIYQIRYMDAVPDRAACNEAVRLAKKHAPARLSGFVNGVLRNEARAREKDAGQEDTSRYALPSWLTEMWIQQLGEEQTMLLKKSLMEIRPVSIRLREGMPPQERETLLRDLAEAGAVVEEGRWLPGHRNLYRTSDLRRLPGFAGGLWTVQDESSMLAVEAAGLQGGEVVYDVCAAPGGKSFYAAEKLLTSGNAFPEGRVLSFDLSRRRTDRIREGMERLHLSNIRVAERDARTPCPDEEGCADILFCDVPCSGLGVMGKKRDIKYNASPAGIEALQKLQREILANAVRFLKKDGILIFSTCTISRLENEENAAWIEKELHMVPDSLAPYLPEKIPGLRGHMLQLLPHVHGTDGFFIARFRMQ